MFGSNQSQQQQQQCQLRYIAPFVTQHLIKNKLLNRSNDLVSIEITIEKQLKNKEKKIVVDMSDSCQIIVELKIIDNGS